MRGVLFVVLVFFPPGVFDAVCSVHGRFPFFDFRLLYVQILIDDLRKSRGLHSVSAYKHGLYR